MYRISNVTRKDLPEILNLLKKCDLDFKRNISDLEKAKKISDVFLVYKNKGKNVVTTVRAIFDGYYCILFDLAVKPEFRNRGIGELLMKKSRKEVKETRGKVCFSKFKR